MIENKIVENGTASVVILCSLQRPSITFGVGEKKEFEESMFKLYEKAIISASMLNKDFRVLRPLPFGTRVVEKDEVVTLSPIELAEKELKDAEEYLSSLPPKARKNTLESVQKRVEDAKVALDSLLLG